MTPLLTAITRRLRAGRDEWIERVEDSKTGHRDKHGRRTRLWHEREYETERRRKKREARRREKEMIEGKKGKKEGTGKRKGKKALALMSGAIDKEEGNEGERGQGGGGGHEGSRGRSHASQGGIGEEAVTNGAGPIVSASEGVEGRHDGGSQSRGFSPMPSEHSHSSIQAQVHSRVVEKSSRSRARSEHGGAKDSEDEEAEGSSDDDSFSDDEDIAAKAAKAAKNSDKLAGEGKASGLREGGDWDIAELDGGEDDEEKWFSFGEEEMEAYNESEAFDVEYTTLKEQSSQIVACTSWHGGTNHGQQSGQFVARSSVSFSDSYGAPEVDQMNDEGLDHIAEHTGPHSSTRVKEAAEREHEVVETINDAFEDGEILWCTEPDLSPKERTAAKPDHESIQNLNTKHDLGKDGEGEHAEFNSFSAIDEAMKRNPENGQPQPGKVSANSLKTEGSTPTQPKGKPGEREPRPYGLPKVSERLKLRRTDVPIESADPSKQPRPRAASATEPQSKGRESQRRGEAPRAKPKTTRASGPATAGPSEDQNRAWQSATEPRVPGCFPEADFGEEFARYKEEVLDQGKPRTTGHPYRRHGAHRYGEASRANDRARNAADGPSEPGRAGPKVRVVHTYEEFDADGVSNGGGFRGAMLQSDHTYRGDPYESYDRWDHGGHAGPRSGGPHRSRFGKGGPSYAAQDGERRRDKHSHPEDRPRGRHGPTQPRRAQPDSSTEDTSSDDSRDPSPTPPPRHRKPQEGGRPPPVYNDVDSVKTAPLNHYALLGISTKATAKEVKLAGKRMRIQTHPDKLLKPGMSEEEVARIKARSARVGQAHELLKDPAQRERYDAEVRDWRRQHGGVLPPEAE